MSLFEVADFIKTITRPTCVILMVVCISVMVFMERTVPTWFWATFLPIFTWWSVDRSLTHLSERRLRIGQR